MDATADPRAWKPMAFGRVSGRKVKDPIYEPLWAGQRALVHAGPGGVAPVDETATPVAVPAELLEEIAAALFAESAVLDGYLVPGPLADTSGIVAPVGMDAAMSPRQVTRQMFLGGGGRNERREAREAEAARRVRITPDEVVAFVAVDLLAIDGVTLLDVPLQERKRLLDSALSDTDLVRRGVAVRAPVEAWYAQWKALGFREVAVKAANGRYRPGARSEDWATEILPRR